MIMSRIGIKSIAVCRIGQVQAMEVMQCEIPSAKQSKAKQWGTHGKKKEDE